MRIEFAATATATATAAPRPSATRAISTESASRPAAALASPRHADSIQLPPNATVRQSAPMAAPTPLFGTVITAMLQQIAAILALLGQINQNGKQQEAAEEESSSSPSADPLGWVASSSSPKDRWADRD